MNFLEFLVWIVGLIFLGIPAIVCLTIVIVAWIDSRAAGQAQPWGPSPAVGNISQYRGEAEEPEEEA